RSAHAPGRPRHGDHERGERTSTTVARSHPSRRRAITPYPRDTGARRIDRWPDLRGTHHRDDWPTTARRDDPGRAAGRVGGDGDFAGDPAARWIGNHRGADSA